MMENGRVGAAGSADGATTILQFSDSLVDIQPNEKQAITSVSSLEAVVQNMTQRCQANDQDGPCSDLSARQLGRHQPSASPWAAELHAVGAYTILLAGCGLLLALCTGSWVDIKPDERQATASFSYADAGEESVTEWVGQPG